MLRSNIMTKRRSVTHRRDKSSKRGGGISSVINRAIDLLPIELHVPGYRYCGPGTKLEKRLARGDPGINPLDDACKIHDIAYSKHKDTENRRIADSELATTAWKRFRAPDASVTEKAVALSVATVMGAKGKLGGGLRKRGNCKGGSLPCLRRVKRKRKCNTKKGKSGGMLPLVPIFAGLSALGSLAGGAANVAKALAASRDRTTGKGLYLKPYKVKGGGNVKKKVKRSKKKKRSTFP